MTQPTGYQLFSMRNPEGGARLSCLSETPGLEKSVTSLGEANLKDSRSGQPVFMYDPTGAYSSAFEWRQQFHLYNVDVLVVFGIGLGWEWYALKPWMDANPEKEVIFLEDDLLVLSHFLDLPQAQEILSHPRTSVFYVDGEEIGKRIAELIAWNCFRKKREFVATRHYLERRQAAFLQLRKLLNVRENELSSTLDEFYSFGKLQFRNFFKNILSFSRARKASDLFGAFRGLPAIVVAAGPSLEAIIPHLRELHDHALIISGGPATNALLEAGVVPHLCATVDPNPAQYGRLKQIQPFGVPLLYQSRVIPEGIRNYPGELLYLRGGNGQPLIEWFDKAFGISGKIIDGGHGVANMIIELAHRFGCGPIIMVGYDLSYPLGRMYPSVVKEALSEKEKVQLEKQIPGTCQAKSNDGKEVRTEEKWLVEAAWIGQYKLDHPQLPIFNTSAEGLAIPNVPVATFVELKEKFLKEAQGIGAQVHTAVGQAEKLPFSMEKISAQLSMLAQNIEKCMGLLQGLRERNLLVEEEFKEELLYQKFLSIYDRLMEKKCEMHRLYREIPLLDEQYRAQFEEQMQNEKIQFLENAMKALSQYIHEFVSFATFEGFFLTDTSPLRALTKEDLVPVCLKEE